MDEKVALRFVFFMGIFFLAIGNVGFFSLLTNNSSWSLDDLWDATLWATPSTFLPFLFIMLPFFYLLRLLHHHLHLLDQLAEDGQSSNRVKAVIWVINTLIGLTSALQASIMLSLPLAWCVWALLGCTSSAGFYFIFIKRNHVSARNWEASPVEE